MAKRMKKDFDKEKMYQKIMPSLAVADPPPPKEESPPEELPLPERGDGPQLHNYMEDMAREKMGHTMKVLGSCECLRCQKDILAAALNQLPAAYAVSDPEGDPHYIQKLRGAYEVKVTASLIKAVQLVKANPRH